MSGRRRGAGEGSLSYDRTADRWRGILDLGTDGTGKRRRVKVTAKTKKEAAERLAAKRAEYEAGDRAPSTMTVADLIDEWLAAVTPSMTPQTAQFARWTSEHSRYHLGAKRLTALRAADVDAALAKIAEGEPATATRPARPALNRTSVGRVRGTLARILRWAQRRDLVARNAAELSEMPKAKAKREGRSLTAEELEKVLAQFSGHRLEALWRILAGCGLRPAEALGLRWSDVDFENGVVHVTQALAWRQGEPVVTALKTARSKRSLGAPGPVVEALRRHRKSQAAERLALRWPTDWADLVFLSEDGTPLDRSNLRRQLNAATKAAKVGHVRIYDLRHTCASLMADAGVRLEDIADYLGHEGTNMARSTYVHRLTEVVDAAVIPLGKAMGEG